MFVVASRVTDAAKAPMRATYREAVAREDAGALEDALRDGKELLGTQAREAIAADLLIEAVLPLVRLQARKSGTRIEVECPRPSPRVWADRTMVEQVLLNLTRNGIQAMENDTPLERRVLTLHVRQTHERWVTLAVRDQGPGIPPEVAAQLFTPFFTTRPEGMGLGLSLCRTVIEQHGGALDFVNLAGIGGGRGTEFRFTLPADSGDRAARAADRAAEAHG